ncbi:MAG: hypothetical protein JKY20_09595 [Alphaproteobacteria bacterium]|nr:hypothetical protein [Alphaproteobacteria bacterium]
MPLITIRQLRLGTGLVLFTYVTFHLINHMAGLWSLDAMDAARHFIHWPLFNPVGVTVLYGAMMIHGGLAFMRCINAAGCVCRGAKRRSWCSDYPSRCYWSVMC